MNDYRRADGVEFRGPGLDWWINLFRLQRNGENVIRPDGVGRDILMYPSVQPVIDIADLAQSPFPASEDYRRAVQVYNPLDAGKAIPLVVAVESGAVINPERILQLKSDGTFVLGAVGQGQTSQVSGSGVITQTGFEDYGILENFSFRIFSDANRQTPIPIPNLTNNGSTSFYAAATFEVEPEMDTIVRVALFDFFARGGNTSDAQTPFIETWNGPRFIIPLTVLQTGLQAPTIRVNAARTRLLSGTSPSKTLYWALEMTIRVWATGDPAYPFSGPLAGVTWVNFPIV